MHLKPSLSTQRPDLYNPHQKASADDGEETFSAGGLRDELQGSGSSSQILLFLKIPTRAAALKPFME